jgi:hypothetical protein
MRLLVHTRSPALPREYGLGITGLAALPDGLLACGTMFLNRDMWLMRLEAEGMPVFVKCYAGTDSFDQLEDVIALADGVLACGSTRVGREADGHSDVWMMRTSVDAMLHFLPDGA